MSTNGDRWVEKFLDRVMPYFMLVIMALATCLFAVFVLTSTYKLLRWSGVL